MTDHDPFILGLMALFKRDPQLKPASISKKAGLSDSAIRKMFQNPGASPKISSATKIAEVLGMTVEDVISNADGFETRLHPTFPVTGKVFEGARVEWLSKHEKVEGPKVRCPPGLPLEKLAALEIQGDVMEPVYSAGDVLLYDKHQRSEVPEEAVGHRCFVEDEIGNMWIRQLKPGDEPGLYHLISLNPGATTMWNVRLERAARIRLHWPSDLFEKLYSTPSIKTP
ncbi:phage repressor protein [bacterium]|nr:phage repressor protein [bacterium]